MLHLLDSTLLEAKNISFMFSEICKNSDYYTSSSEYETMDEFEVRVHREGDVGIEYEIQSSSNDSDLHDEDSDSSSGVEVCSIIHWNALREMFGLAYLARLQTPTAGSGSCCSCCPLWR